MIHVVENANASYPGLDHCTLHTLSLYHKVSVSIMKTEASIQNTEGTKNVVM